MVEAGKSIFRLKSDLSLEVVEMELLRHLDMPIVDAFELLLATRPNNDPLVDSWRAIAIATLYRNQPDTRVRLWGLVDKKQVNIKELVNSLPGLTALYLSKCVTLDGPKREKVDVKPVISWIANQQDGFPTPWGIVELRDDKYGKHGVSIRELRSNRRLLIEFGDFRARKLRKVAGEGRPIDNSAFRQVAYEMFDSIDVPIASNRGGRGRFANVALESLAEFMKEIFENAYRHGRCPDTLDGSEPRQLRFMQVRKYKHLGGPISLADRANRSSAVLGSYIKSASEKFRGELGHPIVEVTISDFGLGIVEHFLSHTRSKINDDGREQLLVDILSKHMSSSKMDPSAGLGLVKAMEAARAARAFVSVRTNEFWYGQSFAEGQESLKLRSLSETPLPKVAGTHWHFIWGPQR